MTNWFELDRSETDKNRKPDQEIGNGIIVINPALGINIYRNAISKSDGDNYISVLENTLNGQTQYSWSGAMVTESDEVVSSARNCLDFKIRRGSLGPVNEQNSALYEMHESAFQKIKNCTNHYSTSWGVGIQYFEAFNFVKYDGPGTHFKIHADHGPAYVTTVSVVAYINDDYEGGEIYFPRFDLTIKPQAGDVIVFPSTYVYEHASQDMISGTKYAIVVMTDYNSRGNLRNYNYRESDNELSY
jgi:hypothetical protein